MRDDILRQKNVELEMTPLQSDLWKRREDIQPKLPQSDPPLEHEFPNLKAAIDLLRTLVGNISDDPIDTENIKGRINWRRAEITMAQSEIKRLQQCLNNQNRTNAALERYFSIRFISDTVREVELFRTIYNARIEYYRQLQLLSVRLYSIERK